ncbi:type II toxin-antitoxin system prevent-host-death family antitoxin [Psychromonas aquimarina]|uniref:type II toxin-antitoxin system Phd/YefM family antitoxin n=1 Tax=Psychromonas aquimarina TaxID=444919 RepID=UPI00048EBF5A
MQTQTYTETRAHFKAAIESVTNHHEPLIITSKSDDVILMSREDYDSMQETVYLLSSINNSKRLQESIAQLDEGSLMKMELNNDGNYEEITR